jgi:hypothetical protein
MSFASIVGASVGAMVGSTTGAVVGVLAAVGGTDVAAGAAGCGAPQAATNTDAATKNALSLVNERFIFTLLQNNNKTGFNNAVGCIAVSGEGQDSDCF